MSWLASAGGGCGVMLVSVVRLSEFSINEVSTRLARIKLKKNRLVRLSEGGVGGSVLFKAGPKS